jgi:hypothetical protein
MDKQHILFFEQLLKVYEKQLKDEWTYSGNYNAQQAVITMGAIFDNIDMVLIDIDDEHGKRALYTLQALLDKTKLIALTNEPNRCDSCLSIDKKNILECSTRRYSVINLLYGSELVTMLNQSYHPINNSAN